MSESNRTKEEYLKRYADTYCEGDMDKAKTHSIVIEVLKEIEEGESNVG